MSQLRHLVWIWEPVKADNHEKYGENRKKLISWAYQAFFSAKNYRHQCQWKEKTLNFLKPNSRCYTRNNLKNSRYGVGFDFVSSPNYEKAIHDMDAQLIKDALL